MEYKLIVAGGRDFNNYELLAEKLNEFANNHPDNVSIVSGAARGADAFGAYFAKKNNVKLHEFPADWELHGKAAGFIRNKKMGDFADGLLAFWDGESRGTKHMIDYMNSLKKPVQVVSYKP
jgi:hypothetical protein